jgi:hypothetical protein
MYGNTTGSANVAVGRWALLSNTTASNNTAIGYAALYTNTAAEGNTAVGWASLNLSTGAANTAVGRSSLGSNTSGANNTALGYQALVFNTTASNNTAVGYQAGYSNTTSTDNTFIGHVAGYTFNTTGQGFNAAIGRYAGYGLTTGTRNTFVGGTGSGYLVTTGAANTILGCYTGNQDGLDIRTASNYVVLSDGDGNRQITMKEGQTLALDSAVPNTGTGITFPATQSASSDANTLDDYEEGTWTPVYNFSTSGAATTVSYGSYVKVGQTVFISCYIYLNSGTAVTGEATITGFPFTSFATAGAYYGFAVGMARRFTTDMPNFRVYMNNNLTVAGMMKNATNATSDSPVVAADFNVQAEYNILWFSGTYRSTN